jgi:hypothetical protein
MHSVLFNPINLSGLSSTHLRATVVRYDAVIASNLPSLVLSLNKTRALRKEFNSSWSSFPGA